MFKEIVATILLACSGSSNSFKQAPRKATFNNIYGTYNFREEIDTSYTSVLENQLTSKQLYFDGDRTQENPEYFYNVPLRYGDVDYLYYLDEIDFAYVPYNTTIAVVMYLIGPGDNITQKAFTIDGTQTIEDIYNRDNNLGQMYFYVTRSTMFDAKSMALFNMIFTRGENRYTKNYSGYYSINGNVSSLSVQLNMFGTITIGNEMFVTLTSSSLGTLHYFNCNYWDYDTNSYQLYIIKLPLNQHNISTQWYLDGVKMTQVEYQRFSAGGQFSYVPRATPDAYSFNDLFFSLADTPIYFIYSIFNWQLFGVNLFIAFIGLISFALVLVLFRRFL